MPENTIHKYFKNDTVKNKDPYGFERFARSNIQRVRQLTGTETDTAVVKPATVTRDKDSFRSRSNASGSSGGILNNRQNGLDSYKRSALNAGGTVDRTVNTKPLGGSAGPSTLRTASSLIGPSRTLPAGILTQNKPNANRAADTYRTAALPQSKRPGPLSSGSGLSAGTGANPSGGGSLPALRPAAAGNTSGLSALIKRGISQYESFEPKKPETIYEPGEEPGAFIEPVPPPPNDGESV